jgi:uncharacterized membrane protein YdfJ with MMPL/SSD domain
MVGIGVGIDYSLLVVSRHRSQLLAGMDVRDVGPTGERHRRPVRRLRRGHGAGRHLRARAVRLCPTS